MKLLVNSESWLLKNPFTISRGTRTHAEVVTVSLEEDGVFGRGECTPYARYGESIESTVMEFQGVMQQLRTGKPIAQLLEEMKPGATRNALDCAWWDLRAKQAGKRVSDLLGRPAMKSVTTAYTLSLASPAEMEENARANASRPLIKIKTGGEAVVEIVAAVRRGAPESRLVVDANEAWREEEVERNLDALADLGVSFVEQPLPAGKEALLGRIRRRLPVFADEAFHTSADLEALLPLYDGINIKLDKTGGFSEGLCAIRAARKRDLSVLCGCMLGTSLAMAPMMIVAQEADYVDLDAPLLLASDRPEGIRFEGSVMHPFGPELWG